MSHEQGPPKSRQFSTFYLGDRLYGIDVMQVQEVTRHMPLTTIRLSPPHVKGLINLRGQIATAIGLSELFDIENACGQEKMNVVCNSDGNLFSLLVDRIGDVVEVPDSSFEAPPDTLSESIRRYIDGVYKTDHQLLSVINIEHISKFLNKA